MPDKTTSGENGGTTDAIKNILGEIARQHPEHAEKLQELQEAAGEKAKNGGEAVGRDAAAAEHAGGKNVFEDVLPDVEEEIRKMQEEAENATADPGAKVLPFRKETDWNAISQQVMQGMEMMNDWYKAYLLHEVAMTKAKMEGLRALRGEGTEIKVEVKL